MPNPLTGVVLAGTAYADAATIQDVWNPNGGSFLILNGSIVYSLQYGHLGQSFWTQDQQSVPGGGVIPPTATGVKFKNLSSAAPATVSAIIAQGNEPALALTFAGALAGASLTGIVNANGTIAAGTGFTVNRTGAGVYVVTFTAAFSAAPDVQMTMTDPLGWQVATGGFACIFGATSVTGAGFTAKFITPAGGAFDAPFNFTAQAVS
jgi:hypothetical protein